MKEVVDGVLRFRKGGEPKRKPPRPRSLPRPWFERGAAPLGQANEMDTSQSCGKRMVDIGKLPV